MQSRSYTLVAFGCAALLAACGDDSPDAGLLADVSLTSRVASAGVQPPPDYHASATATVTAGRIEIRSAYYGDQCGTRTVASLGQSGSALTLDLRLVPRDNSPPCLAWIAETDVVAHSVALPAGAYQVGVRVHYESRGVTDSASAGTVSIE